ncbi:MAG: hypothetical protein WC744_00585 [Patescibacteria group bacterium]|jgi:hypothetical protein
MNSIEAKKHLLQIAEGLKMFAKRKLKGPILLSSDTQLQVGMNTLRKNGPINFIRVQQKSADEKLITEATFSSGPTYYSDLPTMSSFSYETFFRIPEQKSDMGVFKSLQLYFGKEKDSSRHSFELHMTKDQAEASYRIILDGKDKKNVLDIFSRQNKGLSQEVREEEKFELVWDHKFNGFKLVKTINDKEKVIVDVIKKDVLTELGLENIPSRIISVDGAIQVTYKVNGKTVIVMIPSDIPNNLAKSFLEKRTIVPHKITID